MKKDQIIYADPPRLLDLCCKGGGATEGYKDAGFYVVGVDREHQPNYAGNEFYQADALEFPLEGYDAYHTCPPCQDSSKASMQWRMKGKLYPQLIPELRARLLKTGKPFVIENVKGAPLIHPIMLTGAMFGLRIKRDRYFEIHGFEVPFTLSPTTPRAVKMGRPIKEGDILQPIGHFSGVAYAQKEMGLPNRTQGELAEALPRVYTEYIGRYLIQCLNAKNVVEN